MFNKAIEAAIRAGEEILKIYARDFKVEFKADESPLTEADTAAHNLIVKALESTPYPVLSEESRAITYEERKDWKTYWLVDPLDGTKEFIKKSGEFTVNIALIEDGVPTFGVVYVPVLDTLYCGMLDVGCRMRDVECAMSAWKAGAWKAEKCSGKSVKEILNTAVPLSTSHVSLSTKQRALRVVASISHCNDETRTFISALEKKYEAVELVSRGSSLKLCMVAEGSADIYPRIAPTMEWDTAAAHAVVKAAGGEVFEYDPAVPATAFLCEKSGVESGKSVPTSHLPPPANHSLRPLRYNKENLLNPYFVVSRI